MSKHGALVSIIIPAFNAQRWIRAAIDSALSQTWAHCEIIVIDDGSTDGTAALVEAEYGLRVKLRRQPNRGVAAARNAGLEVARGDYVQFLDADDILLPSKVATHVDALRSNPTCTLAYCDWAVFTTDPKRRRRHLLHRSFAEGDVLAALLTSNLFVPHAALVRRDAVVAAGGFASFNAIGTEDYDLWLRLAARGARFVFTPRVLVLYRRHPGSMSSNWRRQLIATQEVIEQAATYLPKTPEIERLRRNRLRFLRRAVTVATLGQAAAAAVHGRLGDAGALLRAVVQRDDTPDIAPRSRAADMVGKGTT